MAINKDIWTGVEELTNDPAFQKIANDEFHDTPEHQPLADERTLDVSSNRRDFLKFLGFSAGAAAIAAGCDIPVKKAIPYVMKPDSIVPGVATYYATSFVNGGDFCSVLVKTREGRPIKIEGNASSPITRGGTSARAQASVLSLYDTNRLVAPQRVSSDNRIEGMTWGDLDKEIKGKLSASSKIAIIANTVLSPTTRQVITEMGQSFQQVDLVMYDPISSSALLQANGETFGLPVVPNYHFDKAQVIVSFDADFLGTWLSGGETFSMDYITNRTIKDVKNPTMSRHYQVESHMSLTGSNADHRILVKPSEQGAAIVALYNAIAKSTGNATVSGPKMITEKAAGQMAKVAKDLLKNKGKSLVVAGSNNKAEQILVNGINQMLGNYGHSISFDNYSLQRQGLDNNIQGLIKNMGRYDAVFVMDGANPAFDLPNVEDFKAALAKVKLKVSFSGIPNETSTLCDFVAPTNHYLESWGDAEPQKGMFALIQPTIQPIFKAVGLEGTRQAEESLLVWSNSTNYDAGAEQPYMDYVKKYWRANIFPQQGKVADFQRFWDSCLHDGFFTLPQAPVEVVFAADAASVGNKVSKPFAGEGMEISFFETTNMGAGQYATNPWLMEMPDPVTRCVWGNYLGIPIEWNGGNDFVALHNLNSKEMYSEADIVEVTVNGEAKKCTVIRQFGQMLGTVSLALGYGRSLTGQMGRALGNGFGTNVNSWLWVDADGNTQYYATGVNVSERVEIEKEFACVQYHHSMGVTGEDANGETINVDEKTSMTLGEGFQGGLVDRSIIYQTPTLSTVPQLVEKIHDKRHMAQYLNDQTLYPYEEYKEEFYDQGHHWSMHIDLNACTGCGACQVACIAENNVPVVGKKEVHRHHEMTWLRIDRYYFGDYENPNVVYQPMMCQHCDNAPCENVCPVAATNHSAEGLNQMTYNRCIGTRYCANNCPYKVRRFNWLDYTTADLFPANEETISGESVPFGADNLTRMVLNPDVTVRSRGVIEKCSFCVQRIQEGKLQAKKEGRLLRDADVRPACQTACSTGAIHFGDDNNKESELSKKLESPLVYNVLEEINVRSSVFYTAKVLNKNEEFDA